MDITFHLALENDRYPIAVGKADYPEILLLERERAVFCSRKKPKRVTGRWEEGAGGERGKGARDATR